MFWSEFIVIVLTLPDRPPRPNPPRQGGRPTTATGGVVERRVARRVGRSSSEYGQDWPPERSIVSIGTDAADGQPA